MGGSADVVNEGVSGFGGELYPTEEVVAGACAAFHCVKAFVSFRKHSLDVGLCDPAEGMTDVNADIFHNSVLCVRIFYEIIKKYCFLFMLHERGAELTHGLGRTTALVQD